MKKFSKRFIFIFILAGFICRAGISYAFDIEIDNQGGKQDDIVTFNVSMNAAPNKVSAFALDIRFDKTRLQFLGDSEDDGWVKGELVKSFNFFSVNRLGDGVIRVGGFSYPNVLNIGVKGIIVSLMFKIISCEDIDLVIQTPVDDIKDWAFGDGHFSCKVAPPVPVPSDEAANVSVSTNIALIFTNEMDLAGTEAGFDLSCSNNSVVGSFSWSLNRKTLTYRPDIDLPYDSSCVVRLSGAVVDGDGNSLENDFLSSFTTIESPGFIIGRVSGNTIESGEEMSFTVRLKSRPSADVTIEITSSDTDEGIVLPSHLTFTSEDWNIDQTVTVTGVDDDIEEGDREYTIILGPVTSGDSNYDGLDPDDFSLFNEDFGENAGITISAISGNTTESGEEASFVVVLNSQPSADVTIEMTSSDTDEGIVLPASLTFTPGNWNIEQTVTITGINDNEDDGDKEYDIKFGHVISEDDNYSEIEPDDMTIINTDNDSPPSKEEEMSAGNPLSCFISTAYN